MEFPSLFMEDPSINNNVKMYIYDTQEKYAACKRYIRNQRANFDMLLYMENQLDRCFKEITNQSEQLDVLDEDHVSKVQFLIARFDGFVDDVNAFELQKKELSLEPKNMGTLCNSYLNNNLKTRNKGNRNGDSKMSNYALAYIGSNDNRRNLIRNPSQTERCISEVDYSVGFSNGGSLYRNDINVYKTNNGSPVSESNHIENDRKMKVKEELNSENVGKSLQPQSLGRNENELKKKENEVVVKKKSFVSKTNHKVHNTRNKVKKEINRENIGRSLPSQKLSTQNNKVQKNKDEVVGKLEIGSDATRCEKGGKIANDLTVDNISNIEKDGSLLENFDQVFNYESNSIEFMDNQFEINENEVQSRNATNLSSGMEEAKEKVPSMLNEELGKHMIPKNDLQLITDETNVLSCTGNDIQNLGNIIDLKVENIKKCAQVKKPRRGRCQDNNRNTFSDYHVVTRSKSKELDAMKKMVHADEIYKGNFDLTPFVKTERDCPVLTRKSAPTQKISVTNASQIKNEIKDEIADINKIQKSCGPNNKKSKQKGRLICQIDTQNLGGQQNQADNNADNVEESVSPKLKRRKYIRKKM